MTSTMPSSTPGRALFPDGLRGLAALWVVLFHLSEGNHVNALKAVLPQWLTGAMFDAGHLGVPVFFVRSGFVMALTSGSIDFGVGNALRFVARRLIRLTPPYYAAIGVGIAVIAVKSSQAASDAYSLPLDLRDIGAHGLYLETMLGVPVINTVFWTLCVEVQFYLAFAIAMLLADWFGRTIDRTDTRVAIFGVIACTALAWPAGLIRTEVWTGGFLGFWFSFLAGVLVQFALVYRGKVIYFAWSYLTVLAYIAYAYSNTFVGFSAVTGAALVLAGSSGGMTQWLSAGWLQFLGKISYSLYLLHSPVTGVVFRVFNHFWTDTVATEFLGTVTALALCIMVAWLGYIAIERPSIAWSHVVRFRPNRFSTPSRGLAIRQ